MSMIEEGIESLDDTGFDFGRNRFALLAIGPDHLLLLLTMCEDTCFASCRAGMVGNEAGDHTAAFNQPIPNEICSLIISDDPNGENMSAKVKQIGNDITCAAQADCLTFNIDNRDWSFRRDSSHFAPDEFVEHQIAEDD